MDYQKAIENLQKHGFSAVYFATAAEAAAYLKGELQGETIGFGGSLTCDQMGLYDLLGQQNKVLWHWKTPADKEQFADFTTYITSANAVSETGELVNIDGTGNRVSATLYGAKKLFYVCGVNKLAPDLSAAMDRARNVASPANAKRLGKATPCATTGKCSDCNSPDRICRAFVVHARPMSGMQRTEIVLVGEVLGA